MDANFVRGKNIYDYLIKNSHKASKIFLHENKGLCAEYVRTIVLEYARRPSISTFRWFLKRFLTVLFLDFVGQVSGGIRSM